MDIHGNIIAREGCDRCWCGAKYWEKDRCVSCGAHIGQVILAHLSQYPADTYGNYYEMPEGYRFTVQSDMDAAGGDTGQMIGVYQDGEVYLAVRD